jgi:hypothetical protein
MATSAAIHFFMSLNKSPTIHRMLLPSHIVRSSRCRWWDLYSCGQKKTPSSTLTSDMRNHPWCEVLQAIQHVMPRQCCAVRTLIPESFRFDENDVFPFFVLCHQIRGISFQTPRRNYVSCNLRSKAWFKYVLTLLLLRLHFMHSGVLQCFSGKTRYPLRQLNERPYRQQNNIFTARFTFNRRRHVW